MHWEGGDSPSALWADGPPLRVEAIFAIGVFSGAVEMPPEESNWDRNWKLGQMRNSRGNHVCWSGEDKLGLRRTRSHFQIFEVLSGAREIGIVPCSSRGKRRASGTGRRDGVSAEKKEAFYNN